MGKLILRSLRLKSANRKPESKYAYYEALMKAEGLYALLLEPVLDERMGISDFKILLASDSVAALEQQSSLDGKLLRKSMKSAEQWMDSCKKALNSEEAIVQTIHYKVRDKSAWFRGSFTKQDNLVVAVWSPLKFKPDTEVAPGSNKEDDNEASLQSAVIRSIIHEIRNPLTAIALANQLLMETSNDTAQKDLSITTLTSIIFHNSRKIEEHLRQLLLPRSEDEKKVKSIDICKVVESALEKAESRLFLGRIKVCRNFKPGYMVEGNEARLTTVFLNLIINAIEAMNKENGHLWVSVYPVENFVKVIFRDNGIGMEPEVLKKIFEPNFSNKKSGLGLGLVNVKETLDQHEALITVNSEQDKGTSFIILFKQSSAKAGKKKNPLQYSLEL